MTMKRTKTKNKHSGLRWLLIPGSAVLLAAFLSFYILILAFVPSGSMEQTIPAGSLILGSRLSYRNDTPQRGDIIFFRHPECGSSLLVKRVIAVEGDTVSLENGVVFVNGEAISEDYATKDSSNFSEITVPAGKLLVLGDNRKESNDSRFWEDPFVDIEDVAGKATYILSPRLGELS